MRNQKIIGIYKIENLINGKVYIGQSWDIKGRWNSHKSSNIRKFYLYNAMNKYGIENFKFSIIREYYFNVLQEDLNKCEIFYIYMYRSHNSKFGYNETFGGSSGIPTEETKKRMSNSSKGRNKGIIKKGNTFIGVFGEERAQEIKNKIKESKKGQGKDKTYEELYGEAIASKVKKQRSDFLKGKTWEDRFGKNRSKEIKYKQAKFMEEKLSKKVICITTGIIYNSLKEAGELTTAYSSGISACLHGRVSSSGKTENGTPLKWMLYNEFLKKEKS